jgi:hypothetical protein
MIHQKAYEAKAKAIKDGVYISRGNDEFMFVPLESVQYQGMPLKTYLDNYKQETNEKLNKYEEALRALAEALDANRFL